VVQELYPMLTEAVGGIRNGSHLFLGGSQVACKFECVATHQNSALLWLSTLPSYTSCKPHRKLETLEIVVQCS